VSRALALYQQGCDGGNFPGCTNVGVFYEVGQGVTKDPSRAAMFYLKACDGDHADGCQDLADLYRDGTGVTADKAKALALYRKALGLTTDPAAKTTLQARINALGAPGTKS